MAKGNMILGYLRGAIGDIVFYRSKGQQQARARNRNPNNPRTRSQQTQRAIFSNAVKFYKLCVTNFFKSAYENKKPNESDFNAYIRENVARGCMISRTAYYCEPYPALGNWLVTRGSLQTISNIESDNTKTPKFSFGVRTSASFDEDTPIATISNILLQSSEYQVGDIITILEVDTMPMEVIPTATPDQTKYSTGAIVLQFIVNPNNAAAWKTVYRNTSVRWSLKAQNGNLALYYGATEEIGDELWTTGIHQFAVIHSRNTSKGLKVSTQEIVMNPRAITALETALTDETYKSAVLADWQAAEGAILQGSEEISGLDPYLLSTVGADFLTADRSVVANVNETNIVNEGVITEWDTTHGNATILSIHFDGNQNPNYDIQQIDPTKFVITGINCTYNNRESEYSSIITQVAFTIPTQSTMPTTPINVMYDGRLIMTITFS